MLRTLVGAMFISMGLVESVFSFDDHMEKVTVTVVLEMPGEKPRPLEGAFVYVPQLKLIHDPVLLKWLQENAKPPEPRLHTFVIKDRYLVPQFDIVYVGETVRQIIDEFEVLNIEFFQNTPRSGLDLNYLFREPESAPIKLKTVAKADCRPAAILVSDHTINSITDKNGVAEFLNLPRIEKIPFRISAISDDWKSRFQYSSSSLKISPAGRFEVDTRDQVQEHTIQVVPKASQK